MKKSITTNDTITFCHHLTSIMKELTVVESALAAHRASEAWRMIAVAVKFHWCDSFRESARRAVAKYIDEVNQGYYAAGCMGNFLNDTFMAFTGKACKESCTGKSL